MGEDIDHPAQIKNKNKRGKEGLLDILI